MALGRQPRSRIGRSLWEYTTTYGVTMSIGAPAVKPAVAARAAVASFLKHMAVASRKTFPAWQKRLLDGLDECALSYDTQYALIDAHPLEDYYFAGVVALEAAKIDRLFAPEEAAELLAAIGEQADAAAGRTDRLVSDLVFFIVGSVQRASRADTPEMPHDEVVRALLQKLGVDRSEETMHLMRAVLYLHELGEPLAAGVPQWWQSFRARNALASSPEEAPLSAAAESTAPPPLASRKPRRRAVALI